MLMANQKNRNGRIYPKEEMDKEPTTPRKFSIGQNIGFAKFNGIGEIIGFDGYSCGEWKYVVHQPLDGKVETLTETQLKKLEDKRKHIPNRLYNGNKSNVV